MSRKLLLTSLGIALTLCVPLNDAWGRGRGGGGGGRRGGFSGGGGGRSGGGFSGGAARGPSQMGSSMGGRAPSNFGSSAVRSPSVGTPSRGPSGIGGGGPAGGSFGGPGAVRSNPGINAGGGVAGNRPVAGARPATGNLPATGNRAAAGTGAIGGQNRSQFAAPSSGQLNSFLGLPSDQGLHSLSSGSRAGSLTSPGQLPAGEGRFDVNYGTAEGARGGQRSANARRRTPSGRPKSPRADRFGGRARTAAPWRGRPRPRDS